MEEDAKATRVTVRHIVIEGATLVPTAELQALIADRIGQTLTLAELEQAAQRIAEHYRKLGWFARVYLPEQDVTEGTLRIQVLEGRFSGSSVQQSGTRANAAAVQATITHRLRVGQPLSAAALERGLLIANDLPGIQARSTLQSGDAAGDTQLAIQVQDRPLLTGDLGANNYGSRSTGRAQAVGGLALNDLSGHGDQATLRLLAAQGTRSATAGYSLPLGKDGLRLAAHASALNYELGKDYAALDAEGSAYTSGLTLSWPLVRQLSRNLRLNAGYEHRRYNDDMLGQMLRRHGIDAVTLGVSGDSRDNLGAGGATWGGLQLTRGRLAIRDIANGDKAADANTANTQGGYTKLAWNLSRQQNLSQRWQLQGNLSGQFASGNLASSERMTLGGASQVRAYPANEASGDQGVLVQLELHSTLPAGWQWIAFYDAGSIQQHATPWANWNAGSKQPNRYTLQGAGLGLNWRTQHWQLAASLAHPLGRNPGEDADGRSNDGTRSDSLRGWLNLTYLL